MFLYNNINNYDFMVKTALLYNPKIREYSFGKGHPFTSERFEIFLKFIKKKLPNFKSFFGEITPPTASSKDLELFHAKEYIEIMVKASKGTILPNIFKYTTVDNLDPETGYLPEGIEEAARMVVGSSILAGELVLKGKPSTRAKLGAGLVPHRNKVSGTGFKKAISLGGGLHHAKSEKGEGFCIYNDVVICAKKLLKEEVNKILILDTDAHAGNGTSEAFWEDNRVLFIDIHQDPRTLYPGTGFLEEIGKGKGEGFTVNIPLPMGASDDAYQYVFEKIIFPLAEEFRPKIIIRNGGSDPYFNDGLTNLGLTIDGFKMIGENVRKLADKVSQGKEVDLIASGYNKEILPFAWAALIAGLLNLNIELKDPDKSLAPSKKSGLEETKEIVEELKKILRNYWRCFQ